MKSESDFQLNEVLFENRHKNYGAYVLRNEESLTLTKSLLVGVAFFAALAITPLLINSFQNPVVVAPDNGIVQLIPVDDTPIKKPEPIKISEPIKVAVAAVNIDTPTPTRNSTNEKPGKKVSEIEVAAIGIVDVVGEKPVIDNPPVIKFVPPVIIEKKGPSISDIPKVVDVEASFNGGINSFRTKVSQSFETENFEGKSDILKTTVTFIVERDGSISGITANGKDVKFNKEAEKTIRNIKGKWQPAKLNGENVRSYFTFPVAMQFE